MKVSLVMPTIGRYDELQLFLESLKKQTYKQFELIVVDQNENDKLKDLIEYYNQFFEIKYIKSNKKGLSYNRNLGLLVATGKIIGFPDDDCEYQFNTLERVVNYLYSKDNSIYSCRTLEKGKNYGMGVMLEEDDDITTDNVFETVKSITFFVNISSCEKIELFDTKLGVGAEFGSGEETDFVLRLLHQGYEGQYFSNHIVYHPAKKGNYDDIKRAYDYARGYGALCKKEIFHRKNIAYILPFIKKIFRSIGGILLTKNKNYHYAVLRGRINGFFKYN